MTSKIKDTIVEDMKSAMRQQQKERLATIRLILAALKQKEVDERIVLSDEQVISVLDKMIKQRRESIAQYEAANRLDLAAKEKEEVVVIQEYLPAQLSEPEINLLIDQALKESGATSAKEMGKVMAILKPKLQGRADLSAASAKVKEKLAS